MLLLFCSCFAVLTLSLTLSPSPTQIQLNQTVEQVPLTVSFAPISLFKWQMQSQMTQSWDMQVRVHSRPANHLLTLHRLFIHSFNFLCANSFVPPTSFLRNTRTGRRTSALTPTAKQT